MGSDGKSKNSEHHQPYPLQQNPPVDHHRVTICWYAINGCSCHHQLSLDTKLFYILCMHHFRVVLVLHFIISLVSLETYHNVWDDEFTSWMVSMWLNNQRGTSDLTHSTAWTHSVHLCQEDQTCLSSLRSIVELIVVTFWLLLWHFCLFCIVTYSK